MVSLHAALAVLALAGTGTGQTVMLDFYADWCGPCRSMDATVHELAAKGYPVRRVNIDQERELASQFHVQSIPCFVMVVNGREVDRVTGGTSMSRLEQMCALAPKPSPSVAAAPRGLLRGGLRSLAPGLSGRSTASNPPVKAPAGGLAAAAPRNAMAPGTPVVQVSWPSTPDKAPATDATLVSATVRLRIEDRDGHSCGTGTIIDSRSNEALVLTCGHIFRDSKGQGRIDVDLFTNPPMGRVSGRLVTYDLKRDVGLIVIQTTGPVPVARVAPPGYPIRSGDQVASVGCNNGDIPTVQRSQINSVDRCLGPPNLQVAGRPVVGRSGGGLFSGEGLVIGVCNAAGPEEQEGLYAALGSIHTVLDERGLSSVYQQPTTRSAPVGTVAAIDPFAQRAPTPTPRVRMPSPEPEVCQPSAPTSESGSLAPGEQTALDEIRRRVKEGSEVVCIIHDHRDPQSKSEVISLDRASLGFVNQLSADARAQRASHETSLEIPKPRTPILEWDSELGWRHQGSVPTH